MPILPLMLLALSCGDTPIDDGTSNTDADGGSGDGGSDECAADGECSGWEICESGACVDGDRNNSIDEAESILWDDTTTGWINPAGDVDYYRLSASGGEYVLVTTSGDYRDEDDAGDTVVTVRDSTGKVVAVSDDYPTGVRIGGLDSLVYAWLQDAGDYIIEVEDAGTAYSDVDPVGSPDFAYTLSVQEWGRHTEEPDSLSSPNESVSTDAVNLWSALGVALESPGDKDYASVTIGAADSVLYLWGPVDRGGSEADPRLTLYDAGGTAVLSLDGVTEGVYAYHPMLDPGTYTLELSDSNGGGGDDYWFFSYSVLRESDPDSYPLESEPNDLQAQATFLSMTDTTTSGGSAYAYGNALGFVDDPSDADWFRVPARSGAELVVCVNSSVYGSLAAPSIEVYNSAGDLIESGAGSDVTRPTAKVENVLMDSQDYYLRIVDDAPAGTGAGGWYKLVVYTADFDVGSYADGGYACPG